MNVLERPSRLNRSQGWKAGLWLVVAGLHLGLFAALGLERTPAAVLDDSPPVLVTLIRPDIPPPPPPPAVEVARQAAGGAPASPSRLRLPIQPPDAPPEVLAPPVPAPVQPLVTGMAEVATPEPGPGQGGEGTGRGDGIGDGEGPGRGGTPPMILRGASPAELLGLVPPSARRARQAGRASVNCVIRLDQRLDDCRIVSEFPDGYGFGEAGLRATAFFRYRPPSTTGGRPVEGQRVTINVLFGRQ